MKNRKKHDLTLTKCVFLAMTYIFGWSLAFFIAWLVVGNEPGVLEGCILAPGVVELICTAFIQIGKSGDKKKNNKSSDDGIDDITDEFAVPDDEAQGEEN